MQNTQWKIIGDQLPTKCPIELKDTSVGGILSDVHESLSVCTETKR